MKEKYLNKLNNEKLNKFVQLIHDESRETSVPIIQDDGLDFLLLMVKLINPQNILEIGTAVGFSSIMMALSSNASIDTVERNQEMYDKAVLNIKKLGLEECINVHFCDALTLDLNELKTSYDLIFIDAAKAQNKKFFLKYSPLLNDNGIILTDNILFHGLVEEYVNKGTLENASKDLIAMVRKIHEYNEWLKDLEGYETVFMNVGDGIAVTKKQVNYEK